MKKNKVREADRRLGRKSRRKGDSGADAAALARAPEISRHGLHGSYLSAVRRQRIAVVVFGISFERK